MEYVRNSILQETVDCMRQIGCPFVGELYRFILEMGKNKIWDLCSVTGVRWLMRGMTTLPQGNQELLVVRDKVGRPQVSLG